jgi:acyl-homoserine lactone acylase PvdQ
VRRRLAGATIAACALALAPAVAAGQEQPYRQGDAGGFRNVLPGGQGETVNAAELAAAQGGQAPRSFTDQLPMYTELLKAEPNLTAADLDRYFKDASFGVKPADVVRTERPRAGVAILRDTFGVPHVYGQARADTMFGAGYASAEDRLFLMDILRHTGRGRLTELVGPGAGDSIVRADADQLKIADYSEEELQGMVDGAATANGAEGQQMKADLLAYVDGVNAYIAEARNDPSKMPAEYAALGHPAGPTDWKPTDTVAIASLIGGIFGKGGGSEAQAGQVLAAANQRFGKRRGRAVFDDFRRREDPEAPITTRTRFPFDDPGRVNPAAVALPDLGTLKDRDPIVSSTGGGSGAGGGAPGGLPIPPLPVPLPVPVAGKQRMSNALLVAGSRSATGKPIAVMGPQVGYYSPQILMEMDMHGPGIDARGATFPGVSLYILLGRGPDYAWSATTATTDVVDQFAEKLCNPDGSAATLDSTHYLYKGECVPFLTRDQVLTTPVPVTDPAPPRQITLRVERSVHGPIQSRATVKGQPVAFASARSTYFHELESALAFKRLTGGEVTDAGSFQRAMGKVNFAFNWFYADDRDVAYLQSGWYPRRARGVDPDLPAWGTGEWDWQKFKRGTYRERIMPFRALPKDVSPSQGYIVNWNNKQARGWRSADDEWSFGSVNRSERLEDALRKRLRGGRKVDLVGLVKVMESGATIDPRGQEIYPLLRRVIGRTGRRDVAPLLQILDSWRGGGSHRRDLDGDNVYDESPAVALIDAWWPRLLRASFEPVVGTRFMGEAQKINPFVKPPGPGGSAFGSGWWGYVDKDLRSLLGQRVRGPLSRAYCGRGSLRRCRQLLVETLRDAAVDVRGRYGVSNVADVKLPATCPEGRQPQACDQIEFTTAGAVGTPAIPWQDRPTFQQIVAVEGRR